jgi:hypothetical protein
MQRHMTAGRKFGDATARLRRARKFLAVVAVAQHERSRFVATFARHVELQ